jgi:hypothetical protein
VHLVKKKKNLEKWEWNIVVWETKPKRVCCQQTYTEGTSKDILQKETKEYQRKIWKQEETISKEIIKYVINLKKLLAENNI